MEGKQDVPSAKPRRYDVEELKYLKDSPYVVKPQGLPPADQWMGPPADSTRNSTKSGVDRAKNHDSNPLLDQTPRRPTERHISRNSANPEDTILGPPKTLFPSATSIRNTGKPFDSPDRPPLRDAESFRDRFSSRTKVDGEGDRTREGRNNLRPKRAEGDQDSDGWSTVKPRKSFGTEGAERFNGRMGLDRHRDDRRFKDREDRETKDRPRGFDTFSRDNKDGDHDQDRDTRKNGTGRGRNEPSWFRDRDNNDAPPTPRDRNSNGDRFADRSRGWRDKDRDEKMERNDRGDRRWDRDRDQRQEREPEWMDEPVEEKKDKNNPRTLEDFQKWKDQMSGKDKKAPIEESPVKPDDAPSFFGLEKKVQTPLDLDSGPDKFFGKWSTPRDEVPPELGPEVKKDTIAKAKTVGKSSRFTSFFNQEEPQRRVTELVALPPPMQIGTEASPADKQVDEKTAFAALLMKLQVQTSGSGSTPPANALQQPKPPAIEKPQSTGPGPESFQQYRPDRQESTGPGLEAFQQYRPDRQENNGPVSEAFQPYRTDRQEEARPTMRNPQVLQDLQNQRSLASSQPTERPNSTEQLLQNLVGQRQNALSQSSARPGQPQRRDTQAEFLMGLMKSAPEPQRTEQMLLGMPPRPSDRQIREQLMREQEMQREAAAQRERSSSQRQARPQAPPGFYDDQSFQRGPLPHERQQATQPTQILSRPPPPGLDLGWDRQAQLPPQQRVPQNIAPPPGLANGPSRMPMPQQMFPSFPMGAFPPPDVMTGPPRNMQMPPPGFPYGPPPGFMPPGMSGFQGPEGMAFGAPFDGRGPPPPQGAFRRQ
ncbi:related to U1 SMALL NUCLEAR RIBONUCLEOPROTEIN C [Phialocephala subalpina]|uniref:Related to U1 SMALL NUCLEAR RIBONUCLEOPROTEIN C n=1 Tax=Phialocephala subalpina TaxID=576137 RepID=A0A1L7XED2_9HELO|nr:related to U1 SMALL NUCLEAR RIBONUCLEOPROTEIN C [Phialocephala subalpina]